MADSREQVKDPPVNDSLREEAPPGPAVLALPVASSSSPTPARMPILENCYISYIFQKSYEPEWFRGTVAILAIYIVEIVDGNLRWYYGTASNCTYVEPRWINLGIFQFVVNFLGCITIVWNLQLLIPTSATFVWLVIVIIDFVQIVDKEDRFATEKVLQFLIDFFGYFAIIRYWSATKGFPEFAGDSYTKLKGNNELHACTLVVIAWLHIILTVSIMIFLVTSALACDIESTDAVGALLEMLLLGYIIAYLKLDQDFDSCCAYFKLDGVFACCRKKSEIRDDIGDALKQKAIALGQGQTQPQINVDNVLHQA